MKKIFLLVVTSLFFSSVSAQKVMKVYKNGGVVYSAPVAEVDSVTITDLSSSNPEDSQTKRLTKYTCTNQDGTIPTTISYVDNTSDKIAELVENGDYSTSYTWSDKTLYSDYDDNNITYYFNDDNLITRAVHEDGDTKFKCTYNADNKLIRLEKFNDGELYRTYDLTWQNGNIVSYTQTDEGDDDIELYTITYNTDEPKGQMAFQDFEYIDEVDDPIFNIHPEYIGVTTTNAFTSHQRGSGSKHTYEYTYDTDGYIKTIILDGGDEVYELTY